MVIGDWGGLAKDKVPFKAVDNVGLKTLRHALDEPYDLPRFCCNDECESVRSWKVYFCVLYILLLQFFLLEKSAI